MVYYTVKVTVNCRLNSFSLSFSKVFGKLISGDAEPTPEQEEKALLSSPEGEEKVHNVFICILSIILAEKKIQDDFQYLFHF